MGTSDDSGLFKAALSADQTVKLAHLAERYGQEGEKEEEEKKKDRQLCVEDIQINCCSRTHRGCSRRAHWLWNILPSLGHSGLSWWRDIPAKAQPSEQVSLFFC